jgi:hypothetical protein
MPAETNRALRLCMKRLHFVISIAGSNRLNTGKDDGEYTDKQFLLVRSVTPVFLFVSH